MSGNNRFTIPLCNRLEQDYAQQAVDLTNQLIDKERKGNKAKEVISNFSESDIGLQYNPDKPVRKRTKYLLFKLVASAAFVGMAYFGLNSYFENERLQTINQSTTENYQQVQRFHSDLLVRNRTLAEKGCATEQTLQETTKQKESLQYKLEETEEDLVVTKDISEKQEAELKYREQEIKTEKQKLADVESFITSVMVEYIEKHKEYGAQVPFENFCESFTEEVFHIKSERTVKTLIERILKEHIVKTKGESIEETIKRWNSYQDASISITKNDDPKPGGYNAKTRE